MSDNDFKLKGYEFLKFKEDNAEIYFSTARGDLDFNKNTQLGLKNINKLKNWFNLERVGYLNQIHGDKVYKYDGMIYDGDAIITDKKRIAIGVFTADCVPIIVYDKNKKVIAAVHSGWKGTIKNISIRAIEKMIEDYNSEVKDLKIYIGPHNMGCCYEVSEELILQFKSLELYKDIDISIDRKLNLQKCILKQLWSIGIENNQINTLNICTFCSKKYKLHSYRKNKEESGRMFSFVFIK
ncbi:peptidoglycan editing factor PgeF [Clostridium aestuarii]|uniref:Purine nucleoside phosphorylase n=1 Tax=Clostridium aestuarii TaxID=338193 RepID=A0ABT4D119_9CLOT|nr:peptidoglycan editing factor PgeF [Clostridium aestuarii]MCY6484025.1 peptidoglycan editing factor PgeF [Clostridium aestuarii]